jgi:hypothetical protein
MKHNIQIVVRVNDINYNLEIFDVESIPITYQISDINDFKNNKSTFSKTIKLPLTDNNKKVLGFISNLYSAANLYSPITKTPVWITRDNILIFQGVMEYNQVDLTDDSFSVVVYEDNYQLWSLIGDKYLTDLEYSRYDHTISKFDFSPMTQSWIGDYNNGYYYGFVDWYDTTTQNLSNPIYNFKDLKPLWYLKPLVYQIFAENGYAINSTFFNSDYFENLLVGDGNIGKYLGAMKVQLPIGATANSTLQPNQYFGYGTTEGTTFYPNNWSGLATIYPPSQPIEQRRYIGNMEADTIVVDALSEYDAITYTFTAADATSKTFMIDYNLNYGGSVAFNSTTIKNVPPTSAGPGGAIPVYNRFYPYEITLVCRKISPSGVITYGGSLAANILTTGTITQTNSGSISFTASNWNPGFYTNTPVTYPPVVTFTASYVDNNINGTVQFDYDDNINTGDTVQFYFRANYASDNQAWGPSGSSDTIYVPILDDHCYITAVGPNTITKVYKSDVTDPTGNIDASNSLPKNIKQTDFLNTVFKTFNLYIEPSKEFNNTFNIEPRDVYYSQVEKINDWSNKVDLDQPVVSSILSNQQKKINNFTYKPDKDYWNTSYTNNTQRVYGDYIYKLDNYYLEGENKIELIFSPTPLREFLPTSTTGRLFAPQIINSGPNGSISPYNGCNIRLLTRNKVNPTSNFFFGNTASSAVTYPFYPYVGHTDNPLTPTYDINFAPVSEIYISNYTITPNNLYNTFWNNTMDALSNPQAKLLSVYIYLTPTDIKSFRFNDLIYLEALGGGTNYWRVNKIVSYDPLKDAPTLVELVEAFDYTLPGVQTINIDNINNGPIQIRPDFNSGVPVRGERTASSQDFTNINGNRIAVSGALVNGNDNSLSPGAIIGSPFITGNNNSVVSSTSNVIGNDNSIMGESIYILGDNNVIGSTSSIVSNVFNIGSNNQTLGNVSNIFMIGSNIIATQSNTTYIGSNVIFTAGIPVNNVTWTELTTTLIPDNLLAVGQLYKIDTEGIGVGYDAGIYLYAISTNELNRNGIRIVYAPRDYAPGNIDGFGNYWLGVWNTSAGFVASIAVGRLCIWGGRVWSNTTGSVGTATNDYNLDANWSIIDKNSFTNGEYITIQTSVVYDYISNWVIQQTYNNNVVGVLNFIFSPNPCDITDWNSLKLYNNIVPFGIYNNTYVGITYNRAVTIKNNVDTLGTSYINKNICISDISNNRCRNILFNINNGILDNDTDSNITYNINDGFIFNNTNTGLITQNSNNGSIVSNSNGGNIINNSNNGLISTNKNTGIISANKNNGLISNNSNFVNDIRTNMNNGSIFTNTGSTVTYDIKTNINNGSISGAHTADVFDTVVNK